MLSIDGTFCVDLFEDPAGGYGFEHFRADPEDRGRWTAIGDGGAVRHSTAADAVAAAIGRVAWLEGEVGPAAALRDWLRHHDATDGPSGRREHD